LFSVVALVATNLVSLRLLLPDRVRMPSLRRNNDPLLVHISDRTFLFATRTFNSPTSQRNPVTVLQTSVGTSSSIIAELDETVAVLVFPSCCYYY
jgi:hypothetical protein